MRAGRALALIAVVATGLSTGTPAAELQSGHLRLELGGSARLVYTFTRALDAENLLLERSSRLADSWLLLSRARLDLQAAWGDRLAGQISYDLEAFSGTGLDSLGFQLADAIGLRTWLDADRPISDHEAAQTRHLLYRGWIRYQGDRLDLTVGRQRIPLGRGRLWNPSDLFNPILPLAIEADQRIGQDAARLRWRFAPDLHVTGIWSPQDDPDDHRGALRVELQRPAIDAAVFAGRFRRDWAFGADFARNLGDAAIRGEATFTDLETGGRVWQVVASIDTTLSLGSGLYLLVEHFFNENTRRPTDLSLLPPFPSIRAGVQQLVAAQAPSRDRIVTIVRHQTGMQLGYDLTPLLRADLLAIYDWDGPSAAVVPQLRWAARADLDLALGVQLFVGRDGRSEYGDRPALLIAQLDFYF